MFSFLEYLLIFCVATICCGSLTPLMRKFAEKLEIVDKPNESHKTHRAPVPYLGGMAIIITILGGLLVGTIFVNLNQTVLLNVLTIAIPALVLGIVGLLDDLFNLTPFSRFVAQTLAGLFTAAFIITTNTMGAPTGNVVLDFLLTIFWIVGITNAINFFDNHDGGAAGTIAISSLGLFWLSAISEQFYIAALALLISGSMLGFLFWNRSPAKIYMGDAGSLFLGTLLSSILIRFEPSTFQKSVGFAIPILLLAIPILDTCVVVSSRISNGRSPFKGGQDHISHRLSRLGISKKRVALILWTMSFIFTSLAILVSSLNQPLEKYVLLLSLLLWCVLFIFFIRDFHYV